MREVIVLCEGKSEQLFCRTVVTPHLHEQGVDVRPRLGGKPGRTRHGGIAHWPVFKGELIKLAKERADRHVSVLVDYYGMPLNWPGRREASSKPVSERGSHVEEQLRADWPDEFADRFIPCVQLHEFESLLFVDPEVTALSIAFATGVERPRVVGELARIKRECGGDVERIDDAPETTPSHLLRELIPGYIKVAWGVPAAGEIGIEALRNGCAWLNRWLRALEALRSR
jgi:hypothetical protein